MRGVAIVFLIVASVHAYAMRLDFAGRWQMWAIVCGAYAVLTLYSLWRLWDDGTLLERLRPRWGDLSVGAITAMLLLFGSWGARAVLAPMESPRHQWILRIYAQLGDPEVIQRSVLYTFAVLAIPLMEEIVWRGFVLTELEERFGTRRAWPLAALLYALAIAPSAVALAAAPAGPNPLLAVAALGCGLVWSFTAMMMKRLPPVMFSHMAFTYFTAVQFRWPGS
jgi:membrane protease YdiL (CAAX protease family)